MNRGDLVTIVPPGACGKPRPAVVIQSNLFNLHHSVTILPLTTDLKDAPLFRLSVQPSLTNSLHAPSDVMVDKITTVPREKVGAVFGRIEAATLRELERLLAVWLGIG